MSDSAEPPESPPEAADQEAPSLGLGLDEPPQPTREPASAEGYRVLARKYRPQNFAELIGQ